jgi:hypothetical protein
MTNGPTRAGSGPTETGVTQSHRVDTGFGWHERKWGARGWRRVRRVSSSFLHGS